MHSTKEQDNNYVFKYVKYITKYNIDNLYKKYLQIIDIIEMDDLKKSIFF